ncbi:RNA methyltransferase [Halobacillus sp. Marseille-Q1614]|uniref:TrmH family RNA methyltransferase n=1 Tax=Halobacillus sp. Marseille-Q1614 TaxID=2709134 RepID=UPI00156F9A0A|nr:RNA methyltransferase [Halobacillus sp. Marseille-Q1614]
MITSIQNSKVKEWRKLKKRKYRDKLQRFIVEGEHLVEEALKSNWKVIEVIKREDYHRELPDQDISVVEVSDQVFKETADTETPQGIAAVVEIKKFEFENAPYTLLLDSLQDPGNLGTLIRTADAAGFSQVILGKGTVDVYNEKAIRSTQGSLFHVSVIQGELGDYIPRLKEAEVPVFAATLQGARAFQEMSPSSSAALLLGNEGQGIADSYVELSSDQVYIPIYGKAESLNVAIAGGILMYHLKG